MEYRLDKTSLLVTTRSQLGWQHMEKKFNREGLTLGFQNDRCHTMSLLELVEHNPSNLLAPYYGSVLDNCVGLVMTGHDGLVYRNKIVPHSAAGPDFRTLMLSAGRQWGTIEEITLRLFPMPEAVEWHYSYWSSPAKAQDFLEELKARRAPFCFAQVFDHEQQPKALRKNNWALAALRFIGRAGLVHAALQLAADVARDYRAESVRTLKRRMVPVLEEMMRESV